MPESLISVTIDALRCSFAIAPFAMWSPVTLRLAIFSPVTASLWIFAVVTLPSGWSSSEAVRWSFIIFTVTSPAGDITATTFAMLLVTSSN